MKKKKHNILEKELVVKSKTENLTEIRDFVSSSGKEVGMSAKEIGDMILAVDEACTNIIKHAYQSFPDGEIKIKLKYSEEKFTIIITDHGTSFRPESIPAPNLQEYYRQHRVGGLGMYLMKTLMDDVSYKTVPGKYNQVELSKNISAN